MKIDIDRLIEAELIEPNNRVVVRLSLRRRMRAHVEMLDFAIQE